MSNVIPKKLESINKLWIGKKWDEKKLIELLSYFGAQILPMPFEFDGNSSDTDFRLLGQYFENVPKAFDIGWYGQIRYLVAMRFHAIVFSVQCGIPFINLSYQPKCTNFCRDIGMGEYCLDIYSDYDTILDRLSDLLNNFETVRRNLIFQRQKLSDNITSIMSDVLEHIEMGT